MRNLFRFAGFQAVWFACVFGGARGNMWLGPATAAALLALHLCFAVRRRAELAYVAAVALLGSCLDSVAHYLGATAYPGSTAAWPFLFVPPWICALWVAFATLPSTSLAWLAGKPKLAFLLGAIGGPLSYLAGTRMEAVAVGPDPMKTWAFLAVEYGLLTPLLMRLAPSRD